MGGMPADFVTESDTQRRESADALQRRAIEYLAQQAYDWPAIFDADNDPRSMFGRAASVASALDDQHDCTPRNLERVTFRPYPNKHQGAWRIEVSFKRHGPCSGKEWYVSEDQLWGAWAASETPR